MRTVTISYTLHGVKNSVSDVEIHDLLVDLLDEAVGASSQGGRIADILTDPPRWWPE